MRVFGGGVERSSANIVATVGTVTDHPNPETKGVVGGFSVVDAPPRVEALARAAKIAAARRCGQEVRELVADLEVG
jgi:hypothetical protein